MRLLKKIAEYPNIGLIVLAYIAFIALGMPDGLLGVAWPSIRTNFSVPIDAIGMLIPASVAGYLTSSFLSGILISRWGIGKILSVSCAMTGMALLGYTLVPVWWMMVLLGVLSGLGAGAIDAGLNSYVAANFGEGLMQWLHASYGIGITSGPIIMTIALSKWDSWRIGYRVVGSFQFALAICFALTLSIWNRKTYSKKSKEPNFTEYKTPLIETLHQSRAWLSMLLFFTYVGAETSIGTWTYSLLTESRGVNPTAAGFFTGSYWATFTIGRVIAGLYAKRVGVNRLVQGSVVVALIGTILLIWNPSEVVNLLAVAVIGLAIAPIFPAFMSGTSNRVGPRFATNTIGMQIAASGLGTAIIPSLLGVLARRFSLEIIPICLVIIFSVLFGFYRLSMIKTKTLNKENIS
ncbi:MAG: MFS transporter [Anaerolineaceae bacterium]